MKKYSQIERVKALKEIWDENSNALYTIELTFKKEIDTTKEVKTRLLTFLLFFIIGSALIITFWLIWAFTPLRNTGEQGLAVPLIPTTLLPFLWIFHWCEYHNGVEGYINLGWESDIEQKYFREEMEQLQKENEETIAIAKAWRENHPFEEQCRQVIEKHNSNSLAYILKTFGINENNFSH